MDVYVFRSDAQRGDPKNAADPAAEAIRYALALLEALVVEGERLIENDVAMREGERVSRLALLGRDQLIAAVTALETLREGRIHG